MFISRYLESIKVNNYQVKSDKKIRKFLYNLDLSHCASEKHSLQEHLKKVTKEQKDFENNPDK